MPITRRQFCKHTAGVVSIGVVMPSLWLKKEARAQIPEALPGRKLVVLQLMGGNDGLNTVVPFADARYHALRPTLGFTDSELSQTMLDSNFALHPSMTALKALYDNGKVAPVLGVGYPNPNLSHFTSMDIWHRADPTLHKNEGWLGTYADLALVGKTGVPAIGVDFENPFTFHSNKVVIPDITPSANAFQQYTFQTDARYPGDSTNQRNIWNTIYSRSFDSSNYLGQVAMTGLNAVAGADRIRTSVATYTSTVTYANNTLGVGLKMVAQLMTTIPEIELLYCTLGGFDHHSKAIGDNA